MEILVADHPAFGEHDAGPGHPERPERIEAVRRGIARVEPVDAIRRFVPVAAPPEALERVHPAPYLRRLEELEALGGGDIDADTGMGERSLVAAMLAAGAGLDATRRLAAGEAETAFVAVRPPGHHATPTTPMGFCLANNVAITAAALVEAGARVAIVDIDAHHGNGTQDIFVGDPRVLFISFHQWPLYPGTGAITEQGRGPGLGYTVNVPLPPGATGDVYRLGVDELVAPLVASFDPAWLLVSLGFDAHRRDPLTGLSLSSADFAEAVAGLVALVPSGRSVLFLEGGYDLDALEASVAAVLSRLAGSPLHFEDPTAHGPGHHLIEAVRRERAAVGLSLSAPPA